NIDELDELLGELPADRGSCHYENGKDTGWGMYRFKSEENNNYFKSWELFDLLVMKSCLVERSWEKKNFFFFYIYILYQRAFLERIYSVGLHGWSHGLCRPTNLEAGHLMWLEPSTFGGVRQLE